MMSRYWSPGYTDQAPPLWALSAQSMRACGSVERIAPTTCRKQLTQVVALVLDTDQGNQLPLNSQASRMMLAGRPLLTSQRPKSAQWLE